MPEQNVEFGARVRISETIRDDGEDTGLFRLTDK